MLFRSHSEMNLIYNATFNGVSLDGCVIYVYGLPVCSECAKGIIQVGATRIVMDTGEIEIPDTWKESWLNTKSMLDEVGIQYEFK